MDFAFEPTTVKLITEIGAFGCFLFLYAHDRLVGEPGRIRLAEARIDKIIVGFREERAEDRKQMDGVFDKLAASIDKLSLELDQMRRDRAD